MTYFLDEAPAPVVKARGLDREISTYGQGLGAGATKLALENDANFIADRAKTGVAKERAAQAGTILGVESIYQEGVKKGLFQSAAKGNRAPPKTVDELLAQDYRALPLILEMGRAQAQTDPAKWANVDLTDEGLDRETNARLQAEYRDAEEILAMLPGGASAEFLGGLAGITADVKNLPFMLLGGGGGSFLRVMGREAAINVAAETAFLPSQFKMAERLDIPDPNVAQHLMMAAGAGAVFGGLVEAGARALSYFSGRSAVKPLPGFDEASSDIIVTAAEDALVKGESPVAAAAKAAEVVKPPPARLIPEETRAPNVNERETAIAEAETQFATDFPEMSEKYPLAQLIRRLGGIKAKRKNPATGEMEPTFAASELANMGVTPRTHPFMFNNKTGHSDLDNIVASEHPGLAEILGVEGQYLPRDALVGAIGRELSSGQKTPMSATIAARRGEIDALARGSPAEDFVAGKRADDGFFVNPEEYRMFPDGDAMLAQNFDAYLADKWAGVRFTDAERSSILDELSTRGGDAEFLVSRTLERELEFSELPRVEAEQYGELPPWDEPAVSGLSGPGREGSGGPGQDATPARGGAAGEGRDPVADQAIIPGTDRTQTGVVQAQAAEIAARQQQSKIRRLDQTRVEDDAGGLFGGAQRELFSDPASSEARVIHDYIADDIRTSIEKDGDFTVDMGDGKGERSASSVLDDLDMGDTFSARIDLCGKGPA